MYVCVCMAVIQWLRSPPRDLTNAHSLEQKKEKSFITFMFLAPDNYNTSIKPSKLRNNPAHNAFLKHLKRLNVAFCSKIQRSQHLQIYFPVPFACL